MDAKDFLGTARLLLNSAPDEAACRTVVGRAYYACFLPARKVAFDHCTLSARIKASIANERKILHKSLLFYLKTSSDGSVRKLGEDLGGLCGNRNEADYNMICTTTLSEAKEAIAHAEAFLHDLGKVAPGKIGEAMELYIDQTCGRP